jgi:hypothetical protein
MEQLSATRCGCIAILRVSLVSFVAITLCVASQRVFIVIVVVSFVIDSVRKLLDTTSYVIQTNEMGVFSILTAVLFILLAHILTPSIVPTIIFII